MYFEPWMLKLLEREDYRQTREGRIYSLVKYFAKDFPEDISREAFLQACEECRLDPETFSKDDIYQVKVKLKKLKERYK